MLYHSNIWTGPERQVLMKMSNHDDCETAIKYSAIIFANFGEYFVDLCNNDTIFCHPFTVNIVTGHFH